MFMRRSTIGLVILALLVSTTSMASAAALSPNFRSQNAVTETGDPQNAGNDVIKFTTTAVYPAGSASVTRDLRSKHIQIDDLQNMISVKYFLVAPRECVGGSPRFQILVDTKNAAINPFGNRPGVANVFGYLGDQSFGGNCVQDPWTFEDMTNGATKWETSQFGPGGGFTESFADVRAFLNTNFPSHTILGCGLFDDSGSFAPGAIGTAYFDQVQCHDRTLEDGLDVQTGAGTPF